MMIASLKTTTRHSNVTLVRLLLAEGRPYWPHLSAKFLVNFLVTPLALLAPLPLKLAVDSVIGEKPLPDFLRPWVPESVAASDFSLLVLAAGIYLLIALLNQVQTLISYALYTIAGEGLLLSLRRRLLEHAQRLSLSFHDSKGTAESLYRIHEDARSIQWVIMDGLLPIVSSCVMFVAMLVVIQRINFELAVVALAVSPFVIVLGHVYDRRMGASYARVKELETGVLSVLQEILASIRLVQAFAREDHETRRFSERSTEGMRARVRLSLAEGYVILATNLATAGGTALVLFIGVRGVQSGSLSLGDLLLVIAYLAQLYAPLQTMTTQFTNLQSSLASARRVFEYLNEVPDVVERPHARRLRRARGAVEFCDVSFSYRPDNPILSGISLTIVAGSHVGISGVTGAGKSTLLHLLPRFYDPTGGCVLLDGIDLRDYKLADLRNQFAIVHQEPILLSTSVAENIACGRAGATEKEIVEAARAANAHDFICQLPDGYQTQVGERGVMLSGGERQRISIARAFLRNAPILVLDEPTSAVDTKTEAAITDAIERLARGRTSITIAHRLSTLQHCDVRVVIEHRHLHLLTPEAAGTGTDRRGRTASAMATAGRAAGGRRGVSGRISSLHEWLKWKLLNP
jgi:ATP-binding cassette, subfamily B, bacterial